MKIDLIKPLALLFALSLVGLTACSSEEPPAAGPESEVTSGAEEPMAEEAPVDELGGEPAAEEPAEEVAGEEAAGEEGAEGGEAGLE